MPNSFVVSRSLQGSEEPHHRLVERDLVEAVVDMERKSMFFGCNDDTEKPHIPREGLPGVSKQSKPPCSSFQWMVFSKWENLVFTVIDSLDKGSS